MCIVCIQGVSKVSVQTLPMYSVIKLKLIIRLEFCKKKFIHALLEREVNAFHFVRQVSLDKFVR